MTWRTLLLLCLALPVFAEGDSDNYLREEPTAVDKGKIDVWHLTPQMSVISPQSISLTTNNYVIPYEENLAGLPALHLGIGTSLGHASTSIGDLEFFGMARIGYTTKTVPFRLQNRLYGSEEKSGDLKLHWVPAAGGLEVRYSIAGFPYVRPTLTFGGGVHWLYQTGNFSGINSSFWVPHFFVMPALSFLEAQSPTDWFGGFMFGMTYSDSFASKQKVRAWSFDLSVSIIL